MAGQLLDRSQAGWLETKIRVCREVRQQSTSNLKSESHHDPSLSRRRAGKPGLGTQWGATQCRAHPTPPGRRAATGLRQCERDGALLGSGAVQVGGSLGGLRPQLGGGCGESRWLGNLGWAKTASDSEPA